MKAVIQRVDEACVTADNYSAVVNSTGIVLFLGIEKQDDKKQADWILKKAVSLRIFDSCNKCMEKSLIDIKGEMMIISQFTLLADCVKGNRPSFSKAASLSEAKKLYDYFVSEAKKLGIKISTGYFGKSMKVKLVNSGPETFLLEK